MVRASHLERTGTLRSFLIVPTHQLNILSVKIEAMDVRFYQQFRILSNGTTHLHNDADVGFLKILQLGSVYVLFSARQIMECWGPFQNLLCQSTQVFYRDGELFCKQGPTCWLHFVLN